MVCLKAGLESDSWTFVNEIELNKLKYTRVLNEKSFEKYNSALLTIVTLEYFEELFRVSKNQVIWGGNYFTEFLPPSKHSIPTLYLPSSVLKCKIQLTITIIYSHQITEIRAINFT